MPKGERLTAKMAAFVAAYAGNAFEAAKAAGYSGNDATLKQQAYQLMKHPLVAAALEAKLAEQNARLQINADDVLRELLLIAKSDLRQAYNSDGSLRKLGEMPEEIARVLSGVEVDELFAGRGDERIPIGETRKVKLWDKVKALELLGKHLKLFTEKHEHTGADGGPLFEGITLVRGGKR